MMTSDQYGMNVRNNAADMITSIAKHADGSPRGLSDEMAAALLVAQANLAIAASLAELADVLRKRS